MPDHEHFASRTTAINRFLDIPSMLADPYPRSRELRESGPVIEVQRGAWVLTSHEMVRAALEDRRFTAEFAPPHHLGEEGDALLQTIRNTALSGDDASHRSVRRVINHGFSYRDVNARRDQIRRTVIDLIEPHVDAGEMDLVRDVALPVPLATITDIFGLPHGDGPQLQRWAFAAAVMLDEVLANEPAHRAAADEAIAAFTTYLRPIVEARRVEPGNDLISHMANVDAHGYRMTDAQVMANAVGIFLAGHETATTVLAHSMLAFDQHPEQWELLASDPSLLPGAALECIRYVSPFTYLPRHLTEPVELGGHRFEQGDLVVVLLTAANRDPNVFGHPDEFDVTRDASAHLAQGAGEHLCLGINLAPAEIEITLGELTSRLRDVHVVGDPALVPRGESAKPRTIPSLPITFTARD